MYVKDTLEIPIIVEVLPEEFLNRKIILQTRDKIPLTKWENS